MKNHPHFLSLLRWFCCLALTASFGALQTKTFAEDEPFGASFVQHEDGSKWLRFPTYAGMHFAVERSTDLLTYEPVSGGLFYGDGDPREFYVMDPPPPPPPVTQPPSPPAGAPAKPVISHSLLFCYASETGVYTAIVKRPGTNGNSSWAAALPFSIPKSAAFLASLSIEDTNTRHLLLMNTTGVPAATIASTPLTTSFSPEQLVERDLIFAHQAEILGALTQTHANVTQPADPTPSVTPSETVRFFYKVTCRQIDTNGNGLMDWLEALKHFNPFLDIGDPNAATMSTVDGATNLTLAQIQSLSKPPGTPAIPSTTGFPKTPQDLDGDGVLDELEAIANDSNFTYPKSPESAYVAIWLDQLTGAHAMPRNADNSLPELISMNDNGQLFFDYTPSVAGGPPRRTILVWDQGVYTAMPPFIFHGQPATLTGLSEAKSSTFGGGSIVFQIETVMDDPLQPTVKHAGRYVIWSKANSWGAPVIGNLPSAPGVLDPVPLRLDPETNEYPGGDIDDTVAGEVYWEPVFFESHSSYDNLGNFLGSTRQWAPWYVTTPASSANNGHAIWTEHWRGVCLCTLQGAGLATGPNYPSANWSATRTEDTPWSILWSLHGDPPGNGFPLSFKFTSPSGRSRVALYQGSESQPKVPITWYQGEAGDPFKTVIFQNADADAYAVNSWDAEAKPPAGSGLPYRQGPLFTTSSTLATLTGSGATAQWHTLTDANGAGSESSILNDRAEVLTGLFLWRNNHLVDLSPTINSTKPSNHPGVYFGSNVKSFLNNQGAIAVKHTRTFGGEWLNHTVLLVPVDVLQPKLKPYLGSRETVKDSAGKEVLEPVARVRFSRWSKAFRPTGFYPDFFKEDADRFYIRVGGYVPGLTKLEMSTDGIRGCMLAGIFRPLFDSDGPVEVKLTYSNNTMLSPPTLLVTRGDDDYKFNGTGVDDGIDDATLLADFDSEINVNLPEFTGWQKVVARAMLPAKKIKIRSKFFSATGTITPFSEERIKEQIASAKEIYRQLGIEIVEVGQLTVEALSSSYSGKSVLTPTETDALALVIKLKTPGFQLAADEILVVFTDLGFSGIDVDQNSQIARVAGFVQNLQPPVFVSLDLNQLPHLNTVAHELGHIYTRSGPHAPITETWRLMLPGSRIQWKSNHEDATRFNLEEEKTAKTTRQP